MKKIGNKMKTKCIYHVLLVPVLFDLSCIMINSERLMIGNQYCRALMDMCLNQSELLYLRNYQNQKLLIDRTQGVSKLDVDIDVFAQNG